MIKQVGYFRYDYTYFPAKYKRNPRVLLWRAQALGLLAGYELTAGKQPFTLADALLPVNMQYDVIVVTHHRIGGNINRKYAGQYQQAVFDPLPAMFETLATVAVLAAQKGVAYAARGTVVVRGGIERYQSAPWSRHRALRSNMFA